MSLFSYYFIIISHILSLWNTRDAGRTLASYAAVFSVAPQLSPHKRVWINAGLQNCQNKKVKHITRLPELPAIFWLVPRFPRAFFGRGLLEPGNESKSSWDVCLQICFCCLFCFCWQFCRPTVFNKLSSLFFRRVTSPLENPGKYLVLSVLSWNTSPCEN